MKDYTGSSFQSISAVSPLDSCIGLYHGVLGLLWTPQCRDVLGLRRLRGGVLGLRRLRGGVLGLRRLRGGVLGLLRLRGGVLGLLRLRGGVLGLLRLHGGVLGLFGHSVMVSLRHLAGLKFYSMVGSAHLGGGLLLYHCLLVLA